MGGSSSDSGGSSNLSSLQQRDKAMAAATNRAKAEQEAKSRQQGFDTYNSQQSASKASEKSGNTALPVSRPTKAVTQNMHLAQDLEEKAKSSQINVPVPTVGTVAMNTISSINYNNQAKQLRAGGNPVFDNKGGYQGVVHGGTFGGKVYSGNADYSPIGRSEGASFNSATGTYTSSQMQQDSGNDSQSQNVTPTKTQTPVEDKTDSTVTLSTASRRALIASGGGGAARRNLI